MKRLFRPISAFLLLLLMQDLHAQLLKVLPGNGNYSQQSGPQGASRYQRQFYLVTPAEMKASGLVNGNVINAIGFTIGAAQNLKTKGSFKVYLQNTTDSVSRFDTSLRTRAVNTNSLQLKKVFPGDYEWQVIPSCSSFSDTARSEFSNKNLAACNPPTALSTTGITSSSATFNWVAPASSVTKYYVWYSRIDSVNWILDSTTSTSYIATGLLANKFYQWRVRSNCSSDSSDIKGLSFSTVATNNCNPPTAMAIRRVNDTVAILQWVKATGGSYYLINYRRLGSTGWLNAFGFNDSVVIAKLIPGTTYEWQIRTNCSAGSGDFVAGPNFTTTGATRCYAPGTLNANAITDSSVTLTWDSVPGVSSFLIRYRLKGTISWNQAINPSSNPMVLAHNDSLEIPKALGPYSVNFTNGAAFTYTGGGLYIAWEYSRATGGLSKPNTTAGTTSGTALKGIYGQDSVKYMLSFSSRTNRAAFDSILSVTDFRPETRLGSTALMDTVEVLAVYALGKSALSYSNAPVSALVKSYAGKSRSYPVTLTVVDQKSKATRYTSTQNVSIGSGAIKTVTFNGWTPSLLETDSLIVSIPAQAGETVVNNNSGFYMQTVTPDMVSYEDDSRPVTAAGFDTAAGLILAKHTMTSCGNINVIQAYLDFSAANHPIYAVVLNGTGSIVATSDTFITDKSDANTYHSFYLNSTAYFTSGKDYYIGIAQVKDTVNGYMPVGVQYETNNIRNNAYYRASITGGNLTNTPAPGRLMLRAIIVPGGQSPIIRGNYLLCPGSTNTLNVMSAERRFANKVMSFSSQFSNGAYSAQQVLGAPNVYPAYGDNTNAWRSSTADGQAEFIELGFANPAPINFVDIYETLNKGSIQKVSLKKPSGAYEVIYSATITSALAQTDSVSRIKHIPVSATYAVSQVKIELKSDSVKGFNEIDAVAIGNESTPSFAAYAWSPGTETADTKNVTAPGMYKVTVTTSTGCTAVDSVLVTSPKSVAPVISANGPLTFCNGDSITLTSSIVSGNTWSTGATTKSIRVKTGGSYTVSYNDNSGCSSITSAPVFVTVNSLPSVSIKGDLSICTGGSTTLTATDGYSSYLWSSGETDSTITVNTAETFTVRVTDGNGCKNTATVTTTVAPPITVSITGNKSFCPGSTTTLDAGAGYANYSWSTGATTRKITTDIPSTFTVNVISSNGCTGSGTATTSLYPVPNPVVSGSRTICPGDSTYLDVGAGYSSYLWSTGGTTRKIKVKKAGTYTVTVTNSNGCSASSTVSVSVYSTVKPTISGNPAFCPGGSTTLSVSNSYAGYSWSTGSTTNTTTVNTKGIVTITVIDNQGCKVPNSISVTNLPAPTPVISGGLNFCSGGSTTLTANSGFVNYLWSTGDTTSSITADQAATYTVTVTDYKGCTGSASVTTAATSNPPNTPGPITGPVNGVCNATGMIYSINPVPNADFYVWTMPAGASISKGNRTTSIKVNFGSSFTSGNIVVAASNGCGQSPSIHPRTLAVDAKPVAPLSINGPTVVCAGAQNVTYSVSNVFGATSYNWVVPANATIASGQGTNSITVNFGSTQGVIKVTPSNTCGTGTTNSVSVTFNCFSRAIVGTTLPQEEALQVYPNPSNGLVHVKLTGIESGTLLSVNNSLGNVVMTRAITAGQNQLTLDLRNLAKGIYSIKFINSKNARAAKVIIL